MKKLLALVLSGMLLLGLAACGGGDSGKDSQNQGENQDNQSQNSQDNQNQDNQSQNSQDNQNQDDQNQDNQESSGSAVDKGGGMAPEDYTGTLTVYSPHDNAPLEAGIKMFEDAYPNIEVEVVADGTGNLLNRVAAELAFPIADVLWGGGADSMAAYKDFFQPYKPSCIGLLDPSLYDPEYCWIGESPLPMILLVNTDLVAEADIPQSWHDLTDPKWEGKIAFADPAASGSAFTQLCTMLMLYGEESDDYASGWEFVQSLAKNLVIQSGSSGAHKNVDSGEYPIGITLEKAAVQYDTGETGHLRIVYPADGTSAVPDAVAIVKNCPNPELAKLFVEYILSAEFQAAQNTDYGRRPIRSDVAPQGLPALGEIPTMNYDFDYAAANKAGIVERWRDILGG